MALSDSTRNVLSGSAAVLGIDQLTKTLASGLGGVHPAWLVPLRNSGVGLQLVTADRWAEAALMATAIVVAAHLLVRAVPRGRTPTWAAALVLGGSVGNLTDRALLGSVRDFLPVGHLAVVNLADIAVVAGVAAVAIATRPPSIRKDWLVPNPRPTRATTLSSRRSRCRVAASGECRRPGQRRRAG
jgi:lipoprotein signal peptidase